MKPEVTINEIHEALVKSGEISLATVKRRAQREGWFGRETSGTGRGGKVKLYLSSMLPADIQAMLKSISVPAVRLENLPSIEAKREQYLCDEQQDKAFAKAELAKEYVNRMASAGHGQKTNVRKLFFESYNLGKAGLFPAIYKRVGTVDLQGRTVSGWITKLKKSDWNPLCLADRRGYCGRGKRSITPEQMEIILGFVLSTYNTSDKPIAEIIHQAKAVMISRGHSVLSDSTYTRWLTKDWIPYHYDQWIYWREGEKGLNDKVAYYLERDYDKLETGDLLVADGHVLNFDIINPETKRPKRMMLILFYDFKSSYPLGWEIMPTENTQSISVALRRAILRLGRIPTAVYIDNGRAFKGEYFINKNPVDELKGLYQRLGIQHIIAWAYHGQSKPVERFFKVFGELERLAPTYVGSSIEHKPAHRNRGEKNRLRLHMKITGGATPTIEDTHRAIALWFDKYANTTQGRNSHLAGKTPNQAMIPGPGVDPVALRCLMMKTLPRVIRRNGVMLKGTSYFAPELYGRVHEVYLRYDLTRKESVLVYDAKHKSFICEAFRMKKVHPMASILGTEEDQAELVRQIELKKSLTKQTMSTASEIVETQVIPETRRQIEQAGFRVENHQIKPVKALSAPKKPTALTKTEKKKIESEIAALEVISDETPTDESIDIGATDDYSPEIFNEADHVFSELKDMSEPDRFEKLIELEVRGWLVPKEHNAWMKYFEQTEEYERHQEYFEEYRAKMVMAYSDTATGTQY